MVTLRPCATTRRSCACGQSHHLRAASRETLRQVEPDDDTYQAACDRLEYLASMVAPDSTGRAGQQPWAGEFMLRVGSPAAEHALGTLITEELAPGWPFLEGGAFDGELDRARLADTALHAWIAEYGGRRFVRG